MAAAKQDEAQQDASRQTKAEQWAWRSPELGSEREVSLPQGRLHYFERGRGPVVVFAHGWLANANLWRQVVPRLAERFRCLVLDLPFGAHRHPLDPAADLTPNGCGRLIAGFLAALELTGVTLVGNDSGGAYSQIAASLDPSRVAKLVLNSCETPYDPFPPPAFQLLVQAAAQPEVLGQALQPLRSPAFRAEPQAFGWLIKRPIDPAVSDSYALPILSNPGVLHDASKVMRSASQEPVQVAGDKLIAGFAKPVLLVWSAEDHFFPLESARRYAGALQQARLEVLDDGFSFTPEDQPEKLGSLLAAFASG